MFIADLCNKATADGKTTPINGKRWHAQYPELGTGPVPIAPYISPAYFALERECIFRRVWLNVGREEEMPQPGDYLVKDLAVCNTSILVVRGKDGSVRAFHNICSHRGNKLVWAGRGSCQAFACKFHGWTYNTKGQLTFVPAEDNFFAFDKKEHSLTPVAADTWAGFIFIHLDPQPAESLREYLGEWGEQLQGYPFAETSVTCSSWTTTVRANWKTIRDAFQEGYHVAFLHKRSMPDSLTSPSNPLCHGLDFTLYPRHHRMSVYGNPAHQPTAVEALPGDAQRLLYLTLSLAEIAPAVELFEQPSVPDEYEVARFVLLHT
ncbi:MAG: aromatic ring-hydroxylating oxygenase subunit alpha [Candidatus Binatia bacterium]